MTQHLLVTKDGKGQEVEVQVGWDRPLSRFYMVIGNQDHVHQGVLDEEPTHVVEDESFENDEYSDDDYYLYSNLLDESLDANPRLSKSVDYFQQKAVELGINIPEVIWTAVKRDGEMNAGNGVTEWNADGTIKV